MVYRDQDTEQELELARRVRLIMNLVQEKRRGKGHDAHASK